MRFLLEQEHLATAGAQVQVINYKTVVLLRMTMTRYLQKNVFRSLLLTGLIIILSGCTPPEPAPILTEYPEDFQFVSAYYGEQGSLRGYGEQRIQLLTPYAFIGASDFLIVDISDPTKPNLISKHRGAWGQVDDLVISDQVAFIVSKDYGLEAIDISSYAHPVTVGSFPHKNSLATRIIVINEQYAYYYVPELDSFDRDGQWYRHRPKWYLLNIDDLTNIQMIKEVTNLAEPMTIKNNYVYAAGRKLEDGKIVGILQIIDISDIINPIVIHESRLKNMNIFDVSIVDQVAYVSVGGNIRFLNISDPHSPKWLENDLSNVGHFENMEIAGDIIVGGFIYSLEVKIESDSVKIVPIGSLNRDKLDNELCGSGVFPAYDSEHNLISAPCPPSFSNAGANDIAFMNGYVYVVIELAGLLIFKLPQ